MCRYFGLFVSCLAVGIATLATTQLGVVQAYAPPAAQRANTALTFLHGRYYDSQLGRFTSADPAVPSAGVAGNRYGYGAGNPGVYTDKNGRSPEDQQRTRDAWKTLTSPYGDQVYVDDKGQPILDPQGKEVQAIPLTESSFFSYDFGVGLARSPSAIYADKNGVLNEKETLAFNIGAALNPSPFPQETYDFPEYGVTMELQNREILDSWNAWGGYDDAADANTAWAFSDYELYIAAADYWNAVVEVNRTASQSGNSYERVKADIAAHATNNEYVNILAQRDALADFQITLYGANAPAGALAHRTARTQGMKGISDAKNAKLFPNSQPYGSLKIHTGQDPTAVGGPMYVSPRIPFYAFILNNQYYSCRETTTKAC